MGRVQSIELSIFIQFVRKLVSIQVLQLDNPKRFQCSVFRLQALECGFDGNQYCYTNASKQSVETRSRLEQWWERNVNWDLYPSLMAKVH